jgi:nitrate/nitrite transporter NarK
MSPGSWPNLVYATLSFGLSFAAWGLISALAPAFRTELQLTPTYGHRRSGSGPRIHA